MKKKQTFGKMPTSLPPGYFKAVRWPVLALLDKATGDHRLLDSEGAGVRNLPMSARAQFNASYGHEGAAVSGAVFEVTIDPEAGVMSGRGFLLNDPNGRAHARMIATQAMDRNSVDLADVKARFEEDLDTGEYWVRFTKFNLAATTGVATPAFAEAYAEMIDPLSDDELMASLVGDDPMEELVASFNSPDFDVSLLGVQPESELTASAILAPFDAFYVPEADKPTKIVVTADRRVFGHVAVWGSCHEGVEGTCLIPPRPTDGFTTFNQPGVLTERGQVTTGPIFAYGGHRPAASAPTMEQAYGGIENAWADVRVIEGKHGPWISGVVRPGVSEETVYAARASRISGHWLGSRLKAIVSVNAEAFVVGDDRDRDLVAGFAFSVNDDGVSELVASFPSCYDTPTAEGTQLTLTLNLSSLDPAEITDSIRQALGIEAGEPAPETETTSDDDDAMLAALLLSEPDL